MLPPDVFCGLLFYENQAKCTAKPLRMPRINLVNINFFPAFAYANKYPHKLVIPNTSLK